MEIIKTIAEYNILHDIIKNIGGSTETKINLQDLEQDLYLELIEKGDGKLEYLYETGQLEYYLTRIVLNNIRSKTSRYYYRYKLHEKYEKDEE